MEEKVIRDIFMNAINFFRELAFEHNLEKVIEQLEILEREYNEKNNETFWYLLNDLTKTIPKERITEKEIENLILTKDNFVFK